MRVITNGVEHNFKMCTVNSEGSPLGVMEDHFLAMLQQRDKFRCGGEQCQQLHAIKSAFFGQEKSET